MLFFVVRSHHLPPSAAQPALIARKRAREFSAFLLDVRGEVRQGVLKANGGISQRPRGPSGGVRTGRGLVNCDTDTAILWPTVTGNGTHPTH